MNIFDPYKVELSGVNLVEASAGTGKTYSIATLFLRTLLENEITEISRIVVVTFTNAAANELKVKIRDKLKKALSYFQLGNKPEDDENFLNYLMTIKNKEYSAEILKLGISNFDLASIFTIHSFCLNILKDFTFLKISKKNFVLLKNDMPIVNTAVEDFWRQEVADSDEIEHYSTNMNIDSLKKIGSIINKKPFIKFKNFDDKPHNIVKKRFVEKFPKILNTIKYDERVTTFDEIVTSVNNLLSNNSTLEKIKKSFYCGFVDEFQDTDPIQFEIFKKIFDEKTFFMIGDPKQAIYSFRGGDIFTYQTASEYAKNKYTLQNSYRFEKRLNDSLNALFTSNKDPFFLDFIKFTPSDFGNSKTSYQFDKSLEIFMIDSDKIITSSCNFIAGELIKLKTKGVDFQDVAILVRTNKQAEEVKNTLNEKGIKSVVFSGSNVFRTFEAREIYHILKAVINPNIFNVKTALFSRAIEKKLDNIDNDINIFARYKDILTTKGVFGVFQEIFKVYSSKSKLLAKTNGIRILTNYLQIIEICENTYATEKKSPYQILKWLRDKIASEYGDEEEEIRLESDMEALKVLTLHRSKGLEFKVVFLLLDQDGSQANVTRYYETYHENNDTFLDFSEKKIFDSKSFLESFAEDLRLYYVGLTRGMAKSYLIFPKSNLQRKYSPLNYLIFGQDNSNYNVNLDPDKYLHGEKVKSITDNEIDIVFPQDVNPKQSQPQLFKPFTGKILSKYTITSYSDIVHGVDYYDEIEDFEDTGDSFELPVMSIPKGINTGLFYHNLLENMNFSSTIDENKLIEMMSRYQIDTNFKDTISENLKTVFEKNLKEGISLKDINSDKMLKELEFIFSYKKLKTFMENLKNIYMANNKKTFCKLIDKIHFKNSFENSYLKGYIDLFFYHNNKYYILDWKTNYLGNSIKDYSEETLQKTICSSFYFLQYTIYTFGAVRFLKSRIRDFSPEQFGGVFYIFLRGINKENNAGIYFDNFNDESIGEMMNYV